MKENKLKPEDRIITILEALKWKATELVCEIEKSITYIERAKRK